MSSIISQLQESGHEGTSCDLETTAKIIVGSETSLVRVSKDSLELVEGVEPEVEIKLTQDQFSQLNNKEVLLSKTFIKGDLKPVGSTKGILALVALFESE